jgi:hypothetical protein
VAIVGPVDLLVYGFDGQRPLAPDVARQLNLLRGGGLVRVLDVLYVSRDEQGVYRVEQEGADLNPRSARAESTLWRIFDADDPEPVPPEPLELRTAREVGLDLTAVEGLADLIRPMTCALLVLVELTWPTGLLDAVVVSDGFPIVSGRLEPETMLVLGPRLAAAARATYADERDAALRGAAMLDALATTRIASTTTADVIRPLVAAGLLDDCDVEDAIGALADAGLVPRSSVVRARDEAGATVAEIGRLGRD